MVQRAGSNHRIGDLQRFFTGTRLREIKAIDVHSEGAGVVHVHGVLGVHKQGETAQLLRFGHTVQGQGGLTA